MNPPDKLEYMKYSLKQIYGDDEGLILYTIMKSDMSALFDEYSVLYGSTSSGSNSEPTNSVTLLICLCLGNLCLC